ncbi:MAG: hypothetical protein R2710_12575 [Acidimicrobiales bacterium]
MSVDQGRTDEEIRAPRSSSPTVGRALTPADGISALIWILPAVVAIGGGAVVVASLRRSPPAQRVATDADRELVAAAKRSAQHAPGRADRDPSQSAEPRSPCCARRARLPGAFAR